MENALRILILDDDSEDVELIEHFLQKQGLQFSSTAVSTRDQYNSALDMNEFDVILSDHALPSFNSEEALNIRNTKKLRTPFLLVSGAIPEELAITLIQNGASDYVLKDRLNRLPTAISQAVTRRKLQDEKIKIEEELLKSNERFELAAKAASEAIWDWDLQTNQMVLGEGFQTLFGYQSSQLQASFTFWLRHIHPDDKERVTKSLEEFINKSDSNMWSQEYRYIRNDGSFATVVNKGIVLRENNIPFRMVGAITDITELSERNNELKQFSYIVSHNLNAPLSNLLGILNLVDSSKLDEYNASLIKMLEETTTQLKRIVEHLSYTLIIKNTPVEIEDVDLNKLFDRAKQILRMELEQLQPELTSNFEVPVIRSKAAYLESIFLNLMSNAIKYHSPKRRLHIDVTSEEFMNGRTKICFSDNGLGIDMNRNRDKLFGLYQRFHNTAEGQGMGLYLIKTQIAALGGSIDVESEVDKGTKFIIVI